VVEEQPIQETIRIADLDDNRLGTLVSSTELDPKLRQVLGEVASRRQAVARQRAELNRLKEQRGHLVEDEKRLRDNLSVLGSDAAMKKRLLDKFNETENAIETVTAASAKVSEALAAAEKDLAAYVAGLNL
jgi:septal ring factor EnvC (AmiA/AmiB activator)